MNVSSALLVYLHLLVMERTLTTRAIAKAERVCQNGIGSCRDPRSNQCSWAGYDWVTTIRNTRTSFCVRLPRGDLQRSIKSQLSCAQNTTNHCLTFQYDVQSSSVTMNVSLRMHNQSDITLWSVPGVDKNVGQDQWLFTSVPLPATDRQFQVIITASVEHVLPPTDVYVTNIIYKTSSCPTVPSPSGLPPTTPTSRNTGRTTTTTETAAEATSASRDTGRITRTTKTAAAATLIMTMVPPHKTTAGQALVVNSTRTDTMEADDDTSTIIGVVVSVTLVIVAAVVLLVLFKRKQLVCSLVNRFRMKSADGPANTHIDLSKPISESNDSIRPLPSMYARVHKPKKQPAVDRCSPSAPITYDGELSVYHNVHNNKHLNTSVNHPEYLNGPHDINFLNADARSSVSDCTGCLTSGKNDQEKTVAGDDSYDEDEFDEDNFDDVPDSSLKVPITVDGSSAIYHNIEADPSQSESAKFSQAGNNENMYSQSTSIYHTIEDVSGGISVSDDSTGVYHCAAGVKNGFEEEDQPRAIYRNVDKKSKSTEAGATAKSNTTRKGDKTKLSPGSASKTPAEPSSVYHVLGEDRDQGPNAVKLNDPSVYSVAQTTQGAPGVRVQADSATYNVLDFHGGGGGVEESHVYNKLNDGGEEEGTYNQVDRDRKTDVIDDEYSHIQ